MDNTFELARLGYQQSARHQELKRPTAKGSLDLPLHSDYRELLKSPPSRDESRYLSQDIEKLMDDLDMADKTAKAIPRLEQDVANLQGRLIQLTLDRKVEQANRAKLDLEVAERQLSKFRQMADNAIASAKTYHDNNPQAIKDATDRLSMLRKELQAKYDYADAKDSLPPLTKTVGGWLHDLTMQGQPSSDKRRLAEQTLKAGGIDYASLVKESDRRGLSLTDKAIAEQKDLSQEVSHE